MKRKTSYILCGSSHSNFSRGCLIFDYTWYRCTDKYRTVSFRIIKY